MPFLSRGRFILKKKAKEKKAREKKLRKKKCKEEYMTYWRDVHGVGHRGGRWKLVGWVEYWKRISDPIW